jgi:hypothetical protein
LQSRVTLRRPDPRTTTATATTTAATTPTPPRQASKHEIKKGVRPMIPKNTQMVAVSGGRREPNLAATSRRKNVAPIARSPFARCAAEAHVHAPRTPLSASIAIARLAFALTVGAAGIRRRPPPPSNPSAAASVQSCEISAPLMPRAQSRAPTDATPAAPAATRDSPGGLETIPSDFFWEAPGKPT